MTAWKGWFRLATCAALVSVPIALVHTRAADDGETVLSLDHYVRVKSTAPSIAGQAAAIYLRERVKASAIARAAGLANHVVLFVHGAGTPAEVAFDLPYRDYSWMGYLASAGYDVFGADMTGYGRSTRPAVMNDPCNLTAAQQAAFVPMLLAAPCAPSSTQPATTIGSDWDDVNAAVDYVRALRRVDKVVLAGWSLGGPRTLGYTVLHQDKVLKVVVLAPAYNRTSASTAPATTPGTGAPFNTQSHEEFAANWDRQVGCPDQYDPAASDAVWSKMLESDPVGATWGTGVRRAPNTTSWGWNQAAAARITVPVLLVSGVHDKQVSPARVRELYADLGSSDKVFVDLACSSHNAAWEHNHLLLYRASLEWIAQGTVTGVKQGTLQLGY